MKFIPKYIVALACLALFNSCDDELELKIAYPNDITFNEMTLDRFTFEIYDTPFTVGDDDSGVVTINVSKTSESEFSGFALSNKNFRSYPWSLSRDFAPAGGLTEAETQAAIDSTAFSVFTNDVNRTENYLVGNTTGDNAYFTLEQSGIVEHVLVANTSYNYLLSSYGSIYSGTLDDDTRAYLFNGSAIQNPKIVNTDINMYSAFSLPAPNNVEAISLRNHNILAKRSVGEEAGNLAKQDVLDAGGTEDESESAYNTAYNEAYAAYNTGYVKLIAEGFLNGNSTGNVEMYLGLMPDVDPEYPDYNFVLNDWKKFDLTSLGVVDKVLFKMASSYVDNQGQMIYPTTFCLDGIRLQ
ncbi:DUF4465 domain-containing protein [Formosa sediminum]|uniref:DUF4465 domain-containing protein n=1 Tax=Formosa sediminum TaxID=2594004 RepID=A0A516GVH3_9FLAO|nr:DUF4465 domain-containing protein [Formosa sediminum]QDO95517.1 DUF4465 domain-containing protein [Formosa sediminum]